MGNLIFTPYKNWKRINREYKHTQNFIEPDYVCCTCPALAYISIIYTYSFSSNPKPLPNAYSYCGIDSTSNFRHNKFTLPWKNGVQYIQNIYGLCPQENTNPGSECHVPVWYHCKVSMIWNKSTKRYVGLFLAHLRTGYVT